MTSLTIGLPERNPFFTGREEVLEKLDSAMKKGTAAAITQPQAISGLGGIGKTQTAIEYAHRCKEKGDYQTIFFIKADTKENVESGYAGIAKELDLLVKDQSDLAVIVAAVKRWLLVAQDWLMILDNANEISMVREYLPKGKGSILLTTRAHATGNIAKAISLEKFSIKDGALFLLRRSKLLAQDDLYESASEAHRAVAEEISREMDGLPLALDQAGAYIEELNISLVEYIKLYKVEGKALRDRRGNLAADHASVTVTFNLALKQLENTENQTSLNKQNSTATTWEKLKQTGRKILSNGWRNYGAIDLVRVCALLASQAIPIELFVEGGEKLGKHISKASRSIHQLNELIGIAMRYSLVKRNSQTNSIEIHQLVQQVVKEGMDEKQHQLWSNRVVKTLNKVFPKVEYQNWNKCERLIAHARIAAKLIDKENIISGEAARFLLRTASYLQDRAQYTEAEPLNKRALAIYEQLLGTHHYYVAIPLNNLGLLYSLQGKYEQAEPLYEQALAIYKQALGKDHPDVAATLLNLAGLYTSQGKYEQAESLYKRVLAIMEQALGKTHPNIANLLNSLAGLYTSQGKYEQAESLYKRVLAITDLGLGKDHPDVAATLNNMAGLFYTQGKYEQAEPMYKRALVILEQALGDHPTVANTLNNFGLLYTSQSKYDQAEPLYKRALAILEQALGEHPNIASTLNNLALLYCTLGKYSSAEPLYERSLAIRKQLLGKNHPDVANSLNNLARLYQVQRKYKQAESMYKEAIGILKQSLYKDHPDVATTLNSLAGLFYTQGKYEQAEPMYKRALVILEQALGDHPNVASTLNNLAELYCQKRKYKQAEPLYERALSIRKQVLGEQHPEVAYSLNNMAILYSSQLKYRESEDSYQRAIKIVEASLGKEHPNWSYIMNNYANMLQGAGRVSKAIQIRVQIAKQVQTLSE